MIQIYFNSRNSGKRRNLDERFIENHLKFYKFYKIGIKNCQKQLDYIMPSLVANYGVTENGSFWFISNDTEQVAIDRIESARAINLKEEIACFKLITDSIDAALKEMKQEERDFIQYRYFDELRIEEVKTKLGYSEEKSVFRIRRKILDKLLISLQNLISLTR